MRLLRVRGVLEGYKRVLELHLTGTHVCMELEPFKGPVYTAVFDSLEAPLDGDPVGAFDLGSKTAWLVRPN